jgi:hypothetical protein
VGLFRNTAKKNDKSMYSCKGVKSIKLVIVARQYQHLDIFAVQHNGISPDVYFYTLGFDLNAVMR